MTKAQQKVVAECGKECPYFLQRARFRLHFDCKMLKNNNI